MIEYPNQQERRKSPRIQGNIPVKICGGEFDLVTETMNLSKTGAYCRVNRYVEPMTKLKVNLLFSQRKTTKTSTKKIVCEGVVVRTESVPGQGYYNIAIFFNELATRDANYISDYINHSMGC